ncbi:hypothetical protein [Acaryochloris marina]|uniref:hypothetical protein n=1 Tax=Acaryochloris marina TaxID=155978 RepID=UPI001BAE5C53|nr:hypothetical protein [Acaryochloris marina]QUY46292.1 hypothetical protein I1H34_31830 [Acaryochloris marina S15]
MSRKLVCDDARVGTPETSKSLANLRSAMSPSQSHAFALLPAFIWGCCIIGVFGMGAIFGDGIRVAMVSDRPSAIAIPNSAALLFLRPLA